ncbi:MAG TPA: glycosyltransferase family 39 protein, partial [Acetobacteraceae bacterium]|nr:glycosyltransferase family 39 protein [Acetobacteraceae bacterium]
MGAALALRQRVLSWTVSDNAVNRLGRYLLSPSVFRVAIAGYLLVVFAERVLLFSGGSNDDNEQLLYSQSLEPGYGLRNPPLYTWLVVAFTHMFGAHLAAVLAVKFLLLGGTFFALLKVAKLMAADAAWATAAAAAPLGMYILAWDAALNFSGSVLLICVCVATFWCLLEIERTGRFGWYAALGLSIGAGCLTKYNYLIFCGALFIAAMFDAGFRRRLRNWRTAALAVAVPLVLPFALFAFGHAGTPGQFGAAPVVGKALPVPYAAAMSLRQTAAFAFDFLSPLLLLLPAFFPAACRPRPADLPPALRLVGRMLAIQLAAFLLYFFFAYASGFGTAAIHRHLFFVFILAPLWFIARASWINRFAPALPYFAAALAALAVLAPVALAVKALAGPVLERRPTMHVPYAALA